MQAYGHKRSYRVETEAINAGQPEPRKQAPKGCNNARRKSARQAARTDIKAAIFHLICPRTTRTHRRPLSKGRQPPSRSSLPPASTA